MANRRSSLHGLLRGRRVGTKIFLSLGVLAAVTFGVFLVARAELASAADRAAQLYADGVVASKKLGHAHQQQIKIRMNVMAHAAVPDAEQKAAWLEGLKEDEAELARDLADYKKLAGSDPRLEAFEAVWARYRALYEGTLLPLSDKGDAGTWATVYAEQAKPLTSKGADALDALAAARTALSEKQAQDVQDARDTGNRTMLLFLVTGLLVAGFIGLVVTRRIVAELTTVRDTLNGVAAGDLTLRAEVRSDDELGQMAGALNTAVEHMRSTVHLIDDSASGLSAASQELTATSARIASTAQEASD
ncbi:MCP four helix bundle domain-containing protein, partial [Planobispora siamensis]|uniref:MCP four helix bundle domain-containing protein n=2 Tax=Planobispora siamensis TaxID=936338 RepID=UPI0035E947D7